MRRRTKVALADAVAVVLGGGAVAAPVERGSLAQGAILSGTLTRGQAVPMVGILRFVSGPESER